MSDAPEQLWWSATDLANANLPDLPGTRAKILDKVNREGWTNQPNKVRRRKGRGGGLEFHWTVLPMRARLALLSQREEPQPQRSREDAWADFEGLKQTAKNKAETRLTIILYVEEIEAAGMTRSEAVRLAASQHSVSAKSIWNWIGLISGIAEADRLAYLAPKPTVAKSRKPAALDPAFVDLIKSDWLRAEQPTLQSCYDRAVRVAQNEGIETSPLHQIRRHFKDAISKPTEVYLRKGMEALKRLYPHQDRDKTAMVPLECVCGDYHKFDVFIRWPGEKNPVRAQMVAFSDVYSGKILSWRLSLTANSHTVQLTLGDLIEKWGIPQSTLLDNGREFAAKCITGGTPTRFRFKVKEDDVPGLLPLMGVKVLWATPYSGQSKPIERAFRDLCDRVAKHPAFAGAYTGNKPDAKPENYGNRAIPLDEFRTILDEEIEQHNARPGRRSEVAFGRSFNEVFNEGYASAPIRKASEEQRRMWLMGAEGVRGKNGNGELKVLGTRYWSPWMYRIAEKKVVARFDPDNLYSGLHVYDLEGQYLGHADVMEKGGFNTVEDANKHNRKRAQYVRAAKEAARAEREFTAGEIAARLNAAGTNTHPDNLPEAEVIQITPVHKSAPKRAKDAAKPSGPAPVARLADKRAAAQAETNPADRDARFERACQLEEMRDSGQTLTASQQAWLRDYQSSAEYRAAKRLRDAFGTKS